MMKRIFVKQSDGQIRKDRIVRAISKAETVAWMALKDDSWDERGWHGGGEAKVRRTQRSRPRKGNTHEGRKAHPTYRTW
jgi:hypothetical protein